MLQKHRSISILGRMEIFNKTNNLLGTMRDDEAEPNSQVSVPTVPGLNPKSLRSAYVMKTYVMPIAIRPSDATLSLSAPSILFDNVVLIQASDFPFALPHLKISTRT